MQNREFKIKPEQLKIEQMEGCTAYKALQEFSVGEFEYSLHNSANTLRFTGRGAIKILAKS
jgi:hypothetical protein